MDARIWALVQGIVPWPTALTLIPPPPSQKAQGLGSIDVPDGTAFGAMTYAEAQYFSHEMFDYKTLCIIPCDGVQAVHITGLALQMVTDSIEGGLPGMMFFPDECDGILMIGYGKQFADIFTEDIAASCASCVAFPAGRAWVRPNRHRRDECLRNPPRIGGKWTPPDMTSLENLAPLAEYLAGLNLTAQDQADYRAAEIVHDAKVRQAIQERNAYWKAKHEAGETICYGGGVWGLKPDAQSIPTRRVLQP